MEDTKYYEPPPDYSSDSDTDQLHSKSLGLISYQLHSKKCHQSSRAKSMDERINEIDELLVPVTAVKVKGLIPRSNWTLCEKPKLYPRLPIGQSRPREPDQGVVPEVKVGPDRAALKAEGRPSGGPSRVVRPSVPPPPPPLPPGARPAQPAPASGGQSFVKMASTMELPKAKPRRSMSVKSSVNPFDQDTMKPLISEFRFYQKTQKNILGQKSELQKVIEKRQQREKIKQIEDERTTIKKSGLDKVLQLRATRLNNGNPVNSVPTADHSVQLTPGNADGDEPSGQPTGQPTAGRPVVSEVNRNTLSRCNSVKLILKSLEGRASQSSSHVTRMDNERQRSYCKKLDLPSAGRHSWTTAAVKSNLVL
ncbi:hypothetical protein HDE_03733 [Halotydeus destructor]|nr:hypothetical protein HDE_03733 [Halotydeus destructor]